MQLSVFTNYFTNYFTDFFRFSHHSLSQINLETNENRNITSNIFAYVGQPQLTSRLSKKCKIITEQSYLFLFKHYEEQLFLQRWVIEAKKIYPDEKEEGCYKARVRFVYEEVRQEALNLPLGISQIRETRLTHLSVLGEQRLTSLYEWVRPQADRDLVIFFLGFQIGSSDPKKEMPFVPGAREFAKEIKDLDLFEKAEKIREWIEGNKEVLKKHPTHDFAQYHYRVKVHNHLNKDGSLKEYKTFFSKNDWKMASLPREVRYFENIEYLDFSLHAFSTLPKELALLKPRYISLVSLHSTLKNLPEELTRSNIRIICNNDAQEIYSFKALNEYLQAKQKSQNLNAILKKKKKSLFVKLYNLCKSVSDFVIRIFQSIHHCFSRKYN